MGRRPNIERSVALKLMLPESTRARLDLLLWSTVEGKVPRNAYQQFFMGLLHQHFERLKEPAHVQPTDPVSNRPPTS